LIRKIIGLFFVRVDLYCINLQDAELFNEKILDKYSFEIINDISDLPKLNSLFNERGEVFRSVVKERLLSGNFLCFCFIEKESRKMAYTRWLRKDSFYHEKLKEIVELAEDEAFTMDSYTLREFRGQGLHTEMNKRMLNFCKNEMNVSKVYMVIFHGEEYSHLHRTVEEIGYFRIRSRLHFQQNLINRIKKKFIRKNG